MIHHQSNSDMINVTKPSTQHGGGTNGQADPFRLCHDVTPTIRCVTNTTRVSSKDTTSTSTTTTTTNKNTRKNTFLTPTLSPEVREGPQSKLGSNQPSLQFRGWRAWRGLWWWGVVVMVMVTGQPSPATGSLLDMVCSSVCGHGTCSFPVGTDNKPAVRCHCHAGWGGDHCARPCTLPCGNGRCVFVGDHRLCLCALGFRRHNCSHAPYDVTGILSLTQLLQEGGRGMMMGDDLESQSPSFPSQHSNQGLPPPPTPAPVPAVVTSLPRLDQTPPAEPKGKLKPTSTPPPKGKVDSPRVRNAAASSHRQTDTPQTTVPVLNPQVTSVLDVMDARKTKRALLVALVASSSEFVSPVVQTGGSQCSSNFVCNNGGTCQAGDFGGFRCACSPPYFGTFCDHKCSPSCFNGAHCVRVPVRPRGRRLTRRWTVPTFVLRCVCPDRFFGPRCEHLDQSLKT
ncbi:hypothetical protein ACOMHN_027911 [Nucella lapillus]